MKRTNLWALTALTISLFPVPAQVHHRHHHHTLAPKLAYHPYSWEGVQTDLSPIIVAPYVLPTSTQDLAKASYLRRMNLEDGLEVKGTRWIQRSDVRSRDLFILNITQSLEGGFDSVNVYDKGILSFGIMQWAARYNSLDTALIFIKRRLLEQRRKALWEKTFVANAVDVNSDGLILYGKPMQTAMARRITLRGTMKVGGFDPKLAAHWAITFARAGRQPAIQALQVEYASHIVDSVLDKRLRGVAYRIPGRDGITPADLASSDPYCEALIFALWTNNPRHAMQYIASAANVVGSHAQSADPRLWPSGAFSAALRQSCSDSRFGNWRQRAEMIEQRQYMIASQLPDQLTPFERDYLVVLMKRKDQRAEELASRSKPPVPRKLVSPLSILSKSTRRLPTLLSTATPGIMPAKPAAK